MHPTTLVLSLVAILFSQMVLASGAQVYNRCTCGDVCSDIRQCDLFGPYPSEPKKWTAEQRSAFSTRFCNKEQSPSGENVYKVCCPKNPAKPPARGWRRRLDLLDLEGCGPYTSDRIAGGEVAKLFEYPWMALLRSQGRFICGGTLINTRYILTAAHCVKDIPLSDVRLGEFDMRNTTDCDRRGEVCAPDPQDIAIQRSIIHEDYSARCKKHDIALLRLAREATINDNVIPICLPVTPDLQSNLEPFFVAGWGATETSLFSSVLLYAKLNLVNNNDCQHELVKVDQYVKVFDTQICAKGEKPLSDNCGGDSGGPLKAVSRSARFVQYGVVSFGLRSCGKLSAPGVYTRVQNYVDWILDKLED